VDTGSQSAGVPTPTVFREKPLEVREARPLPPDRESLLRAKIKDLKLHLAGTPLERHIQTLHSDLEAKGISYKPQCYLSDQWGCPSGVPVIGIPFYLADPKLHSLEEEFYGGVESEQEILMYLRHESGHALNYAYKLYDTEEWKKLFGDYAKPYKDDYKAKPFSRKYVIHISGWYAQKHPDEDFAETFAVWLTPGSDWQRRYAGWGALKKLQYVDQVMQKIGNAPPLVTLETRDLDASEMEETVLDHYKQRQLEEKIDLQLQEAFDAHLVHLFEREGVSPIRAETLLRAETQTLLQAVTHYSGVGRPVVKALIDHIVQRADALNLTVHIQKVREYLTKLSALLTTLAMNYVYTDRFFED
jgi:hypothetical protein